MPAALVQAKSASGSGTSLAVTFDVTPTAGNLIYVAARANDEQFSATIFDDNKGNTYTVTRELEQSPGSVQAAFAYTANITSSATFTVTLHTAAGTDLQMVISEWSGVATVSPRDVGSGRTDSSTDQVKDTGTTATLAQADSIAIAGFADHATGFTTWSEVNSWLIADQEPETVIVYKVLAATTGVLAEVNCGHGFGVTDGQVDVFKAAGGAVATKPKTLLTLGVG